MKPTECRGPTDELRHRPRVRTAPADDAAIAEVHNLGLSLIDIAVRYSAAILYAPRVVYEQEGKRNLGQFDPRRLGAQFVPHTTTYRATNLPIENLISSAYGVDRYQIVGAPNWPWPTFFMIEAKRDSEADAKLAAISL